MKLNKTIALSLAACIAVTPFTVFAEETKDTDMVPISAPIEDQQLKLEYINFEGKIAEIRKNDEGRISILIKNEIDGEVSEFLAHIEEGVLLLSDKTKDFSKAEDLKVGQEVSIYYHKDTIMLAIYPPMLAPNVVIVKDAEQYQGHMVSKFEVSDIFEGFKNAEGDLVIKPSDETVIVNTKGNAVEVKDIANRDLVAFFNIVALSYPGQTSPDKIFVLPEREEAPVEAEKPETEEPAEETSEYVIAKELIKDINGIKMVPLRLVAEKLGYEIKWDQETKTAELTKGPHWTTVTIGQNRYSFARMLLELETAPELVESTTYVPASFIEKVLQGTVESIDGSLKVIY